MNGILREGPGIMLTKSKLWVEGDEVDITEIGISTENHKINPWDIESGPGQSGDILTINENGFVEWQKPFVDDKELRQKYPSLDDAWKTLMGALSEYELVKKLITEHDKS